MVNALDKLKAQLKERYGDNSVMTVNEIPDKGVVSSGSLCFDYMLGTFGIPRDIVVELAGAPGVSKSTMSLGIINNVLELELERAKKLARFEKAVKAGKMPKEDFEFFKKKYDSQCADLNVFKDGRDKLVDDIQLDDSDMKHVMNDLMRNALYLDMEGRFDRDWASRFIDKKFLDWNKVLVTRNDTLEQATDVYTDCLRTGMFAIAILDSVGGAPTQRVVNKSAETGNVGGNALAMTRFSQFAENMSSKWTCLTIGINQIRADLSGYSRLVTPGGMAWQHACSLRIELKRKARDVVMDLEPGTTESWYQCGFLVTARLHKNSVGRSGQACSFWFYTSDTDKYGPAGFDKVQEIVNLAVLCGKIKKESAGRYFSDYFPDGKIRGYDKMLLFIRQNQDVFDNLYNDMKDRLHKGGIDGATKSFEEDGSVGLANQEVDVETGELIEH